MTRHQHKLGNRIVKMALLDIIADIIRNNAKTQFVWLDKGYENDNQRIRFSSDRHKCMLEGVGCPDIEKGIIPLKVRTEWKGEKNVSVDVNLEMQFLHIKTLEKIACEVYNTLRAPEKDDEYDFVRQEYVANWLDTEFYPNHPEVKRLRREMTARGVNISNRRLKNTIKTIKPPATEGMRNAVISITKPADS